MDWTCTAAAISRSIPRNRFRRDLPQITEPTSHAIKNKIENYSYDFRVRGKDSRIHYMHNSVRLLRDTDGKYRFLMGVTQDVTKEVETKQEIARQAEKERALVERLNVATQAAGVAPWEFDLKRGCFSWHGPRPQCFGLDNVPVEDYFAELRKIVLPEDLTQMTEPARIAIEAGRDYYEYRFRVTGIDGKVHHMANYGRILRSERGNIRYCVGVTWDVTKKSKLPTTAKTRCGKSAAGRAPQHRHRRCGHRIVGNGFGGATLHVGGEPHQNFRDGAGRIRRAG